jgi:hypothetical protein
MEPRTATASRLPRQVVPPTPYAAFETATAVKKPFVQAYLEQRTRQLVGLREEAGDPSPQRHTPLRRAGIS